MQGFAAITVAISLAAAPALADAQQHIQGAKKAERRGEWSKALEEWKAAYSADPNAEYLIGIGDAYAKLGNKDEAKKNYEAYLADPLALPANVEKVKGKIADLDSALALPGLGLPAAAPGGLALPGGDLPPPDSSKGKKKKKGEVAPPPLPGLDLPSAPEAKKEAPPDLPGLDLPGAPPPKKEEKKLASAAPPPLPGLDLPLAAPPPAAKKEPEKAASLDLPLPPPAPLPAPAPAKKEVAAASPPAKETKPPPPPKQVAVATPPPKPERRPVPDAAIAEVPAAPGGGTSSTATRVVAFAAAGVAVVAIGGGALALTKASQAHTDLTGKVHDGPTAQQLLETEQRNKTVSFISFAGGLVAAGIATALFAF